ncbi:uncharacterized protein Dvar_71670 [Desulfosarcina variabilis str. Montpellier]|uniref:hypothetical protein n=1 Tax=Desulfosarcina variabilis TaxID=2300 RepID=UPI003AFA9D07
MKLDNNDETTAGSHQEHRPNRYSPKSFYRRFRSYISSQRTNLWRLKGAWNEDHQLMLGYAGSEKNKEYLKEVIFDGNCQEENLGRVWNHRLRRAIGPDASLLISEYDADQNSMDSNHAGFMLPFWLGWIADISGDMKKMVKSARTLEYNLGKIRTNNLEYEIVDNDEAHALFYDSMYLPYIKRRFDSTAHFLTREEIQADRENCELMFIKQGQEYLSGMLIKYETEYSKNWDVGVKNAGPNIVKIEKYPRNWAVGVTDANPDYMKTGAVGALYYYLIVYLKEKGYDWVHFGGTRPFHSDGVLNYKKKWPLQNAGFTQQGFNLQVLSASAATIQFLTDFPFIYLESGCLNSAVFINPDQPLTPKKFKKVCKSYLINGIEKMVLYVFGDQAGAIEAAIPEAYKNRCIVRPANSLFTR